MQADSTAEVILAHPQLGTLQTLPPEIVEDVLVLLAETGYAVSIASLASTCRRLRQLIYDPLDAHLWRRIFLTTFDDPRTREHENASYDWCGRFTSRMQAAGHLQTRTPAYHEPGHHELRSGIKIAGTTIKRYDYTHTLRALLSVLAESLPVPPKPDKMDVVVEAANESPLSPMLVSPSQPQSKNIQWIQEIFKRGLPRELLGRYATGTQELDWLASEESTLLHKLIAHVGFAPLRCEQLPGPNRRHRRRWRLSSQYQWFQLTRVDQYNLARYISQTRVFSMNYLSAERNWGPFLRVDLLPDSGSSPSSAIDPYPLYHAKHYRRTISEVDSDPESDDDADYQDSGEGGGEGSVSEGSDEDEDYVPPESPAEMMPSHKLYPDWVHLAAIRIVVEAHLADHPDWDTIKQALQSWNGLRAGFWAPNIRPEPSVIDNSLVELDWAGAEGVWQRTVCWLDYDDLFEQNRNAFRREFDEAIIIVPLTIRIVKYSPCTVPGYEHYPTIHVEGQMGGAGWVVDADARRNYGTVSIIADGSVRWSMYSSVEGNHDENEWVSEGVQIGGIGSATGILGLWTGADHDPLDPLGAWWQWRVA